jgi:EAL domain-containing protein (putative c-di-GMP-specific phosphodiesterase class I)
MVKAIVGVSQALGIKTVAESVADEDTIDMLQKHQVDYAQGYWVGKPAPLNGELADTAGARSSGEHVL